MIFPCTGCGECCRNMGNIKVLRPFNRGDCVCKHLLENNRCEIYSQRPLICRIDEMYDKVFFKHMDKDTYYKKNADACNDMQERAHINVKYRVEFSERVI